jgi:hypothetical protein
LIRILLLIFSVSIYAQDDDITNTFEYTRNIYAKVKEIEHIKPEEYTRKLSDYRADIQRYIKHKKGVCEGNFSTVILEEDKKDKNEYKLSKQEQELCYRELKGLQLNYINKVFVAKRRYLDYLHAQRIENLNIIRDESLKQLQATFDKKVLRKKRRRSKRKKKKTTRN